MTGYGRGEAERNGNKATVELTSVNGRYLESQIRLPRGLNALESHLKGILTESFSRGKISCTMGWESGPETVGRVLLNEPMVVRYQEVFQQIKKNVHLPGEVTISDFLALPEVIIYEPAEPDAELVREIAEAALRQAIEALKDMRQAEGEKLMLDLRARLNIITEAVGRIEANAGGQAEIYRKKLQARIAELFGENGYDQQRLAEEVAYLAERSDITEECVRLKIHTESFAEALAVSGAVGRRLNFLMQEMNREANTIGSKAASADISSLVVTIKEELEKIREQVQNIE
jgi:uncharacterized protein (TIGR00255 family)